MSENTKETMQPTDAFNLLYQNVHMPVFFNKLAAHGIVPQSEQEAAALLEIGAKLHNTAQAEEVKQASAPSLILQAQQDLNTAIGQPATNVPDNEINYVAEQLAKQASIVEAVRTLQSAAKTQ